MVKINKLGPFIWGLNYRIVNLCCFISGYFSKRPISKKHQILIYQSILETKKVYLVNTTRMPAIQTLMLLGKKIATNGTLTKFVFDDFLLIDAPYFGQGR